MKKVLLSIAVMLASASVSGAATTYHNDLRAPAYPLVTVDPYFSLWSFADDANADMTRHWSGRKQPLLAAVRVDKVTYRLLGNEMQVPDPMFGIHPHKQPEDPLYMKQGTVVFDNAAVQTGVNVLPTSTVYTFECGPVLVKMSFVAPLLLDDLELLSRPVNYVSFSVEPIDKGIHSVELYFEASPRLAVDLDVVPVTLEKGSADGVNYLKVGTVDQKVLEKRGDDVRIDWGYFYMAPVSGKGTLSIVNAERARMGFLSSGRLDTRTYGKSNNITSCNFVDQDVALAWCFDFGRVKKEREEVLMLAYDDIYSVKFLGRNLRPYWNSDGKNTITKEMQKAANAWPALGDRLAAFDADLIREASESGGKEYADLCASAYRQAVSAHKLVMSDKGTLYFISKENFSNGCAGTVDVTYPSIPLFLRYNTEIAKALVNFIFDYAEGPKWNKVWAPHDVGVYPDAYGQHYGNWMPLEESGNMLLITAAIVKQCPDASFAQQHWGTLTKWALYALQNGQDPENQLCTDDFAGKLAHNVNLSAKSILAVAAYAKMAHTLGRIDEAKAFHEFAANMAALWKKRAFEDDHYRLTFDGEGTWSQKYNLVWDKVLELNIFGDDVVTTELEWYKKHINTYGLPLDSRRQYSKTDWQLWTGTMAGTVEGFREFLLPVYKFYNETPDRVPLGDWVNTEEPTFNAMQARSVVGGFFMKLYVDHSSQSFSFKGQSSVRNGPAGIPKLL